MQIVMDSRGLQLSVRNGCFLFETKAETRVVHPGRVSSILVTSPCRLSSPALILAAEQQIPVVICNGAGQPLVRTWSPRFINTSGLRRMQYQFATTNDATQWAKAIIMLKIDGQIKNLQFMANRKPTIRNNAVKAISTIKGIMDRLKFNSAMSINEQKKEILFAEAFAASNYWTLIGTTLAAPFYFENRVKKNPSDGYNACINYLYGMLRNQVETAILSIGLDPALGIMHRDGYRMPSLVFDMMEPFRPIMDRMLWQAVEEGKIGESDLSNKDSSFSISKDGRKLLIGIFMDKLNARSQIGTKSSLLKNLILNEAKNLAVMIKTMKNENKY